MQRPSAVRTLPLAQTVVDSLSRTLRLVSDSQATTHTRGIRGWASKSPAAGVLADAPLPWPRSGRPVLSSSLSQQQSLSPAVSMANSRVIISCSSWSTLRRRLSSPLAMAPLLQLSGTTATAEALGSTS